MFWPGVLQALQVELCFGYTDLQISSVIQAGECIRKTNRLKFFRAAVDLIVPTNASSPVEKPLVDEAGMRPVLPSVPLTGRRVDPRSVLFPLSRCLFCMFLSSEAETPLRHSARNATLQGGVLPSGQTRGLRLSPHHPERFTSHRNTKPAAYLRKTQLSTF